MMFSRVLRFPVLVLAVVILALSVSLTSAQPTESSSSGLESSTGLFDSSSDSSTGLTDSSSTGLESSTGFESSSSDLESSTGSESLSDSSGGSSSSSTGDESSTAMPLASSSSVESSSGSSTGLLGSDTADSSTAVNVSESSSSGGLSMTSSYSNDSMLSSSSYYAFNCTQQYNFTHENSTLTVIEGSTTLSCGCMSSANISTYNISQSNITVVINGTIIINGTLICTNVTNTTTEAGTPVPIPLTYAQKLALASCPSINDLAMSPAENFAETGWCSAGMVDGSNQCAASYSDCGGNDTNSHYYQVAQGIQQDSIYSTNPTAWWRCNYTYTEDIIIPGVNGTNSTIIYNNVTQVLQVVDSACFTDSSKCQPRRYLTRINELTANNTLQWPGQQFPPYASGDRPPLAVVMAGAAMVNATLFYPFVDTLQLLQIQDSANTTFLSLSTSTRIVVEMPGGVISNSRTRINKDCAYVVPFFTLIVTLDSGYPTTAEFEDDCSTCTSDSFVYSDDGSCNCGVPITNCIGFNGTSASNSSLSVGTVTTSSTNYTDATIDCDLKIYIAYKGTDRSSNVLTSSSRTLKNFRMWSFGSLYNNIVNGYNNLPTIGNIFDNTCTMHANPEDPNSACIDWG